MKIPQDNKFIREIKDSVTYEVNQPIVLEVPLRYNNPERGYNIKKATIHFTIKGEMTQIADRRFNTKADSVFNFSLTDIAVSTERTNDTIIHLPKIIEKSIKQTIPQKYDLMELIRSEASIDNGYFYFSNPDRIQEKVEEIVKEVVSAILDFEERGHKPQVNDILLKVLPSKYVN